MTDLGEEFESPLRRAKDVRPGLGFSQGLAGAIIGEGSPGTVSSGSTLGRDIIVTSPFSAGRAGGSRVRESMASVSDDFFSSGVRTSGEQFTFHSLSSVTDVMTLAIDTTPVVLTEETSGSGTVVLYTLYLCRIKFLIKKKILNLLHTCFQKVTKRESYISECHYMFPKSFCNHKVMIVGSKK
jgi:hypothetical protein